MNPDQNPATLPVTAKSVLTEEESRWRNQSEHQGDRLRLDAGGGSRTLAGTGSGALRDEQAKRERGGCSLALRAALTSRRTMEGVNDLPQLPASLGRKIEVRQAALEAGHLVEIEHVGKRFRISCPCGWKTATNWTRKRAFAEVTDHIVEAGRQALGQSAGVSSAESLADQADVG